MTRMQVPEDQNDLRKMQLRELVLLNGPFREGEIGPNCSNSGATTHKAWQCPDKPNVTNAVVCNKCGGTGHIARDCRAQRPFGDGGPDAADDGGAGNKIDEEYMSLMAELGEGPAPKSDSQGTNLQNLERVKKTTKKASFFWLRASFEPFATLSLHFRNNQQKLWKLEISTN